MGVFEVAEFQSFHKIWVGPFLVALDPIFALNFCITSERWVVRAPWRNIVFPHEFYIWMLHIRDNFGNVVALKIGLTVKHFFRSIYRIFRF